MIENDPFGLESIHTPSGYKSLKGSVSGLWPANES